MLNVGIYLIDYNKHRHFAVSLSEQVLCYFQTLSFMERLPTAYLIRRAHSQATT